MHIQGLVGDDMLEFAVFLFQVFEALGLGDFHSAALGFSAVVGLFANAVPAAQVRYFDPGLSLLRMSIICLVVNWLFFLVFHQCGRPEDSQSKWFTFTVACHHTY
jgi:hypothetical protein